MAFATPDNDMPDLPQGRLKTFELGGGEASEATRPSGPSDMGEFLGRISEKKDERPALDGLLSRVHSFKKIDGWLTESEGQFLFSYAAAATNGCIVEIGSYRGRSTAALCAGASAGSGVPVYAIDPHEEFIGVKGGKFGPEDRRVFFKTMIETGMAKHVRLLNAKSATVTAGWTMPVCLLFLDGDHRYEPTLADFLSWQPHLSDGAVVLFAEALGEGPRRVIAEALAQNLLSKIESVGKIAAFKFNAGTLTPWKRRLRVAPTSLLQRGLDSETVAYNVYFGGGGKYLYQPIPKCACTTLKTILLELEGLPIDEDEWKRHQKGKNNFPGAEKLRIDQLQALFADLTPTFKFVIVRDPYTRLASAYKDKIRMDVKPRAQFWRDNIIKAADEQGMRLSDVISFEEFVRVVASQPAEQMDAHWRHQYLEGRFGFIKFNFVGHMEKLQSDLSYILEQIGASDLLHAKATVPSNVTNKQEDIWDTVPAEARRHFVKAFEIDFDLLRYPHRLGTVS